MKDATYRLIADLFRLFVWDCKLEGTENLPECGPAVFVSNHVGAIGPIAVVAALPIRVYPWVIGDMLERTTAAAYLNMDFTERQLHLRPPLSLRVSEALSKISVPLLRSAGCVGVWQGEALVQTFQESLDLLARGKCLLIFPEDPHQALNERYQMSSFQQGFTHLAELFYRRGGASLKFHPLVVHIDSSRVKLGAPVSCNPENPLRNERARIAHALEAAMHDLYTGMAMESHLGIPLPR